MKKLLYLLPLLFALHSTGQTKEEIFNQCFSFTDSGFSYFYLLIDVSPTNHAESTYLENLKGSVPDSTIKQLQERNLQDTLPENWNCALIKGARCLSEYTKPFHYEIYYYYTNPKASEKEKNDTYSKMIDQLWKVNAAVPKEVGNVFEFSRMIFDNTNHYALFTITDNKSIDSTMKVYLLKKIGDKWILFKKVSDWLIQY